MKRIVVLLISVFGLSMLGAQTAHAAVNDFTISDYSVTYDLSRSNDNRSQLKTVETITAVFPAIDQNHGLERALPTEYQGHSTNLKIQSITDQSGKNLEYGTTTSNDNLIVRIGNKDTYVHGPITYVLTYTQQDVTYHFADTSRDEFYWNVNETQWQVPITNLSATLHIDDSIKNSLTNNNFCYYGSNRSNDTCEVVQNSDGSLSARQTDVGIGKNITLAVGFNPGTFAAYSPSATERFWQIYAASYIFTIPLFFIIIILIVVKYGKWTDRTKERGAIVTEFLPPKDTSITTAAGLIKSARAVFTAQLLDFAVRGYLKIYQTREKKFLRPAEYDIEITKDVATLKTEEQEILNDIFGSATVGARLSMKSLKNNTTVYSRMQNNDKQLKKLVRGEYGLRQKDSIKSEWFKKFGFILLVVAILLLSPVILIAAIASFISAYTLWPLTDKGLALSQYLLGLKQYIKVAETDRLAALQSPEGALKIGNVDVTDNAQLVKLYEEALPYAALFGLEKEWNKQIGERYESANSSPNWYSGNNAVFNAAVFSSAMGNFSTASTYTSASSSSSGGSSGGGSSGGGGGGGGGGGW